MFKIKIYRPYRYTCRVKNIIIIIIIIIIMFFLGGWRESEITPGIEIKVRLGIF